MLFVLIGWLHSTYQGFQSDGKGATIPSLAINRRSLSLIGSIPIDCAYSNISAKKNFQSSQMWWATVFMQGGIVRLVGKQKQNNR